MALAPVVSKVFRKAYSRENGIVGCMSSLQLVGRAQHQDNNRKQLNAFKLGRASEQREMEHGMNLGANDYAIKGFYTPKDILAKISTALESTDKKSDEPKLDSNSYFLSIDPEQPDSVKLQKAFGLPTGFNCPLCNKPLALELELLSTHSRTVGHWFASHFLCKTCHTDF
jgi:DNA-binding response OmpR family regulator